MLLLINFSFAILIYKAFYLDNSDMSYLSALMALLIHLDLFSKHIGSQGNVHLQFCLFLEHFTSTEVYLNGFEHMFSSPVQWGYLSVTKGGDRS